MGKVGRIMLVQTLAAGDRALGLEPRVEAGLGSPPRNWESGTVGAERERRLPFWMWRF